MRVTRQTDGMTPGTLNITMIKNTSALIGGLNSNTKYIIQVSAFTSAGEGNSTSLSVMTHHKGGESSVKRIPFICLLFLF